ncbi:hypothetical protein M9458_029405, partial [Cirrhinus mrigala]
ISFSDIGGFISFNGSWRVQGVLAMSRSLGDYPLKNLNVLIPDPDVLTFDLDKLEPQFMILANEEAVHFIKERLDEPHFVVLPRLSGQHHRDGGQVQEKRLQNRRVAKETELSR